MKEYLSTTKNSREVFISDETKEHMKAHSDVLFSHIKKALMKVSLNGTFFMESIDLGEVVGKDHCLYVPEEKWSEVEMVQRPNRKGPTPMIHSEPEDTSLITVGVCLDADGLWTLFTSFYGVKAPKEPWDAKDVAEKEASEKFWSCHALCF